MSTSIAQEIDRVLPFLLLPWVIHYNVNIKVLRNIAPFRHLKVVPLNDFPHLDYKLYMRYGRSNAGAHTTVTFSTNTAADTGPFQRFRIVVILSKRFEEHCVTKASGTSERLFSKMSSLMISLKVFPNLGIIDQTR